jgi:hypothetical protein
MPRDAQHCRQPAVAEALVDQGVGLGCKGWCGWQAGAERHSEGSPLTAAINSAA